MNKNKVGKSKPKKITLLLAVARMGKSYTMRQIINDNTLQGKNGALFTFAHANRIRQINELKSKYGIDYTFNSTVHAAIPYDNCTLLNADVIYIDEVGLFPDDHEIDTIINQEWYGKKEIVATGDVHQIQNGKMLYTLVMEALKQGGKKALEQYNLYAEWKQLIITEQDLKRYKRKLKDVTVEIRYIQPKPEIYVPPRQNLEIWETQGNQPFVNKITLDEAIQQGYQILTATQETRDYVIATYFKEWYRNMIPGETILFCKNNQKCNRKDRSYYNGVDYIVMGYHKNAVSGQISYELINYNAENGKRFTVNKTQLISDFQPPECICVQKGQGTDFPNVVMYIKEGDTVNRQLMYTAVSRARNQYHIIIDGDVDKIIKQGDFVVPFGNMRITNERQERLIKLENLFNPNAWRVNELTNKKQLHEYLYNEHFYDVNYRQFCLDFDLLFPSYKFPKPIKVEVENMTIREDRKAKKVLDLSVKMLLSDRGNRNYSRRLNSLRNILNNNKLDTVNVVGSGSWCKPYIYNVQQVPEPIENNLSIYLFKMLDEVKYSDIKLNEKINPKTEDLLKFINYNMGDGSCWHLFFYVFGVRIIKRNPQIQLNESWLLATHYLYYNALLYPEKQDWFTSEILDKSDIYLNQLADGMNVDNNINRDSSKKLLLEGNCDVKKTYAGNISGRFSPCYKIDNKYYPQYNTNMDWDKYPPKDSEVYTCNLYDTNWIVIDLDTTEELIQVHSFIKRRLEQLGGKFFETTKTTGQHKLGGHVWLNVGDIRIGRIYTQRKIDVLGNSVSSLAYIKPNKYPKGFNPNTDIGKLPLVSLNDLVEVLQRYELI